MKDMKLAVDLMFKIMMNNGKIKIVGENFVAPTGRGSDKTGVVTYWDLDKDAWRCLGMDSLVSVESFTNKSELL